MNDELELENLEETLEIQERLKNGTATEKDVARLSVFAEKGDSPLAEFLFGACLYFGEKVGADMSKAFYYFDKCRTTASGALQMKIAKIYFDAGPTYLDRAVECVKAAADDFEPRAMKIVKQSRREARRMFILHLLGLDKLMRY
jgi:TPR repeat protein